MKTIIKSLFKLYNGIVLIVSFVIVGFWVYFERLTNWRLIRGFLKAWKIYFGSQKTFKDSDTGEEYKTYNSTKFNEFFDEYWGI